MGNKVKKKTTKKQKTIDLNPKVHEHLIRLWKRKQLNMEKQRKAMET